MNVMRLKIRVLALVPSFVFCFLLAVWGVFAQEQTILIKNGTLVPVVGNQISNGSILLENGKIAEIGTDITAPSDAYVIDAQGKFIYPGMVALMTSIGVTGYPGAGNDQNEVGVSTPHMDPYDALNPEDSTIEVTRMGGVTTVHTTSGSRNVFNGKSVVINLEGNLAPEMLLKPYAAQIFNIGARQTNRYPSTLPGTASLIRDKLNNAVLYAEKLKKEKAKENQKDKKADKSKETSSPFKRDLEMEALVPVVSGKVPALFLTSNEVTIRNALNIIREYKLKAIIQAGEGIQKYADQLAAAKIPLIWAGTTIVPNRWQPFDFYYCMAGKLAQKGVLFTFAQGGFGSGSHGVRNLPVPAALSVAHGLPEAEAIRALTINAAKILGIDDKVGSLEVGKLANVVIWSGSPIQMRSRVETVIIAGKIIPMTSVQTRLRNKFDKIVRDRLNRKGKKK